MFSLPCSFSFPSSFWLKHTHTDEWVKCGEVLWVLITHTWQKQCSWQGGATWYMKMATLSLPHTHTHTRAPHRGPCPPTSSWDSDGDIYGAHADWSLLNIHVSSVCQQIAVCIADKMGMLVHVCASIHLHTYVSPGSRVGTGRLHIGRWLNIYCAVMDTLQTFWNWIAVSWQSFLNI